MDTDIAGSRKDNMTGALCAANNLSSEAEHLSRSAACLSWTGGEDQLARTLTLNLLYTAERLTKAALAALDAMGPVAPVAP